MRGLDITRERDVDGDWLLHPHAGPVEVTEEAIAEARAFAFERWREIAAERGRPEPADMSGACKFNALFCKLVFGGAVQGNHGHVHLVVDGRVVDLQAGAADVAALDDPHRHDEWFVADPDFAYSMGTCLRRCRGWAERFVAGRVTAPAP